MRERRLQRHRSYRQTGEEKTIRARVGIENEDFVLIDEEDGTQYRLPRCAAHRRLAANLYHLNTTDKRARFRISVDQVPKILAAVTGKNCENNPSAIILRIDS